jgi:hypothetical protein
MPGKWTPGFDALLQRYGLIRSRACEKQMPSAFRMGRRNRSYNDGTRQFLPMPDTAVQTLPGASARGLVLGLDQTQPECWHDRCCYG